MTETHTPSAWLVSSVSHRGSREHNCDARYTFTASDGTTAAAIVDGTGNSPDLECLAAFLAETAARAGAKHNALAGLLTAGDLIGDEEAAAVLAVAPPGDTLRVAWIGDCRAYWWDGAELYQVTTDHTMGEQLRHSGGLPWEIADSHDHWLLVGLSDATPATVRQVWVPDYDQVLPPGHLVVLTSDGVHDQVPRGELVALVRQYAHDPAAVARALVAAARQDEGGYRDDATAVVLARTGAEPR